jgi:hypothetical protein
LEVLFWEISNAQRWQVHTFDLAAYAGRPVNLYLGIYNDGVGGRTGMYVDHVSLLVRQPTPVRATLYLPLLLKNH